MEQPILCSLSTFLIAGLVFAQPAPKEAVLKPSEVAPGVYVLGSSHRHQSANLGWIVFKDRVLLVGAPDHDLVETALAAIGKLTDKPVRGAVITHIGKHEIDAAAHLLEQGVTLWADREAAQRLHTAIANGHPRLVAGATERLHEIGSQLELGDQNDRMVLLPLGHVTAAGNLAVYLPARGALFTGAIGVNGPRAELPGTNTAAWIAALSNLRTYPCRAVVPGFGTIGGPAILARLERYLTELRRQVGHLIAQERPLDDIVSQVRIDPEWLVWMPYDQPQRPDIEHIDRELTIPHAPFGGRAPSPSNPRPAALVVIGDRPHEPGHIEAGLRPALEQAGMSAFFTVDARALTAANLESVRLLVILRDGATWPSAAGKFKIWMTREQEEAVVNFVKRGRGLLALHNATALYPDGGPYLRLVGGRYTTHGPLERFRISVLDRLHPITRDVHDFEVADEQHLPIPDRPRVHLLLESRSAEGAVGAAGWAHEFERGRVCYLANGHTREALNHPEFQKLLRNAANWCLGGDGGAKTISKATK
jgi:type 1 glutamine amidotransferase